MYYHASVNVFNKGQIVSFNNNIRSSTKRVSSIDTEFDKYTPRGLVGRSAALFAFDDLGTSVAFAKSNGGSGNGWRYYSVDFLGSYHKAPWYLTTVVKKLGLNNPLVYKVIKEYWTPIQAWSFWEYLVKNFLITNDCTGQVATSIYRPADEVKDDLEKDINLARRLYL